MPVSAAEVEVVAVTDGSSAVLAVANRARRGLYIYNHTDEDLFVKCGVGASSSDFSVKMPPGSFWEFPGLPIYVGVVTGRLSAGTGDVAVTELYG